MTKKPTYKELEDQITKLTRQIATFENASERQQLEKRFRQLIKNSFDMIVLLDSSGKQTFVSESCEKLLGYKPEELIGIPVIETMIHPEDQEKTISGLKGIIEKSGSGGTQYRHRHKNGGWVYLEAFGSNQIDNPFINSIVLNVRDITERKNLEETLKISEAHLLELNAAKDKFISILAHDLRNPFISICGFLGILTKNIRNYDIDKIERQLNIVNDAAIVTFKLLEDILIWIKAQSDKISYEPRKCNVKWLCDNSVDVLNLIVEDKKIKVTNLVSPELYVFADTNMISIIILNLLTNALKFTNTSGKIDIYANQFNSSVTITISDNGVGIDPEKLNKVFDISEKKTSQGTAQEKGSGLGLLICKELVEKQGGKIWVESQLEKGSDFKFSLPLFEN